MNHSGTLFSFMHVQFGICNDDSKSNQSGNMKCEYVVVHIYMKIAWRSLIFFLHCHFKVKVTVGLQMCPLLYKLSGPTTQLWHKPGSWY